VYVGTGKISNLFKPFSVSMEPLIENIREKEEILKKYAWMATMETIKGSLGATLIVSCVPKAQWLTILQSFLPASGRSTRVWGRSKII